MLGVDAELPPSVGGTKFGFALNELNADGVFEVLVAAPALEIPANPSPETKTPTIAIEIIFLNTPLLSVKLMH